MFSYNHPTKPKAAILKTSIRWKTACHIWAWLMHIHDFCLRCEVRKCLIFLFILQHLRVNSRNFLPFMHFELKNDDFYFSRYVLYRDWLNTSLYNSSCIIIHIINLMFHQTRACSSKSWDFAVVWFGLWILMISEEPFADKESGLWSRRWQAWSSEVSMVLGGKHGPRRYCYSILRSVIY